MFGAIFGDIIGSRFEFDRGGKTKDFELFTKEDMFTDDTVMTIAVGEALMKVGVDASLDEIKKAVINSMQKWGHRYPNAGYGGRFWGWLFETKNPKPYGSYGNGSAMRVSAAGWLYDSLERTREVAKATAEVTHNHPEGIKGAECTAAVIFLGMNGSTKDEIFEYVTKEFGYDLSESLEQMRKRHEHVESCQDSLPKALRAFFDGESYEDVVRNAVSLGGDTDTLAAIAGAMAEAFYGIPVLIMVEGKNYLPNDMIRVLNRFEKVAYEFTDDEEREINFEDNKYIKVAIDAIYKKLEKTDDFLDELNLLLDVLYKRLCDEGQVIAPMVDENGAMNSIDLSKLSLREPFCLDKELHLTIDKIQDREGKIWIPLYTDEDEIDKGVTPNVRINIDIFEILKEAICYEESNGLVINPFGRPINIPKDVVKGLMDAYCKMLADRPID